MGFTEWDIFKPVALVFLFEQGLQDKCFHFLLGDNHYCIGAPNLNNVHKHEANKSILFLLGVVCHSEEI